MCEALAVPHKSLRRRGGGGGVGEPFVFLLPVSLCQIPSESGVRCFVSARLSVPLCLAGEAAVINKTQEVECSPRCTHRRLHCITLWSESRHDFLSLSLHFWLRAAGVRRERKTERNKGRKRTKKSILHRRSLRASAGVREAAGDTEAANINQSTIFYDDMF